LEGKSEKIKIASLTKPYLLKIEARVKAMQKKTLKNLSKITCSETFHSYDEEIWKKYVRAFTLSPEELSHARLSANSPREGRRRPTPK